MSKDIPICFVMIERLYDVTVKMH